MSLSPSYFGLGILVGLVLLLVALLAYNAGSRRAVRSSTSGRTIVRPAPPAAPLFAPIPAPWWAIPHTVESCVSAKCRIHFPDYQCLSLVDGQWCERARGHTADHTTRAQWLAGGQRG